MFEPAAGCGMFMPPPPVPTDTLGFTSWLAESAPPVAHGPPAPPVGVVKVLGQKGTRIQVNAAADETTEDCFNDITHMVDWGCIRDSTDGMDDERDALRPLPV
jgi:hypothetical protein